MCRGIIPDPMTEKVYGDLGPEIEKVTTDLERNARSRGYV